MLEIIGKLEAKLAGMPQECEMISKELESQCKATAGWHDKTGAARESIEGSSSGSGGNCNIKLSIGTDHGLILEKGAAPHGIDGNPWLYWEGASHPVRHVNHPGVPQFRAVENAAESGLVESRIISYWSDL